MSIPCGVAALVAAAVVVIVVCLLASGGRSERLAARVRRLRESVEVARRDLRGYAQEQ
ncbi:MAG: hypothetical protein IT340_15360 [Chloroflexi bacterium]|nr:hypothetical protein [Chloroflexota bacterium]